MIYQVDLNKHYFFLLHNLILRQQLKNFALVTACQNGQNRACPGVEPGTSRTLSENHTTRPTGRYIRVSSTIAITLVKFLVPVHANKSSKDYQHSAVRWDLH